MAAPRRRKPMTSERPEGRRRGPGVRARRARSGEAGRPTTSARPPTFGRPLPVPRTRPISPLARRLLLGRLAERRQLEVAEQLDLTLELDPEPVERAPPRLGDQGERICGARAARVLDEV